MGQDHQKPGQKSFSSDEFTTILNYRQLIDEAHNVYLWEHASLEDVVLSSNKAADGPSAESKQGKSTKQGHSPYRFHTPRLVRIAAAGQLCQMEIRSQPMYEVETVVSCLARISRTRSPGHFDTWMHLDRREPPISSPPNPLKVTSLVLCDALVEFWKANTWPRSKDQEAVMQHDLRYILQFEGLECSMARKIIIACNIQHAVSTIFREMSNGFSAIFVGALTYDGFKIALETYTPQIYRVGCLDDLIEPPAADSDPKNVRKKFKILC